MGNIFGKTKKKESRVTDQDKAVLQLKQQRDKLHQYQKKIHVQLAKEKEVAKELLKNGKKEKAKLLLRKKKFQESLLEKTDNQLENIEKMIHDVEFVQIEAQVIKGLDFGNQALKKMHQLMSIEDVERIMDDTEEAVEYQREIDTILAGGLSQEDEDDVLRELDEIISVSLPSVPASQEQEADIQLPDVPSDKLPEREKERRQEAMLAS